MRMFFTVLLLLSQLFGDDEGLRQEALKLGLRPVPAADVLQNDAAVALGKKLFFDKNLSLGRDISCASCHEVENSGTDHNRPTAIGHEGLSNPNHLNTPTILNAVYSRHFFWDGRSQTLEEQAKGPIQAPFEMASTPALVEARILEDSGYRPMFQTLFGDDAMTFERVVDALAAYEATLVTRGRYDAFLEGELDALNADEKAGLHHFITYACASCHNGIGLGGQVLRKFPIMHHNIWSLADAKSITDVRAHYEAFLDAMQNATVAARTILSTDENRRAYLEQALGKKRVQLLREGYFHAQDEHTALQMMTTQGCFSCHDREGYRIDKEVLKNEVYPFANTGGYLGSDRQKRHFRVPLLRNIVRTAPYFHNGSVKTLEEAIRIMANHQTRVEITDDDIGKIVRFLKAVDGAVFPAI